MKKIYTKETFEQHLNENHSRSIVSTYLKEIVYGGNDGIVTTFAVIAGFSGANATDKLATVPVISVLLFGLANLFADGISMGLGNFLSLRTQLNLYKTEKKKELYEIENEEAQEKLETIYLLKEKGFSETDATTLTEIYAKNPNYWLDFMMKHELKLENAEDENPIINGLATFFSFLVFGFIPLSPYLLNNPINLTFKLSVFSTVFSLALLGYLRGKISKQPIMLSILETLIVGGLSGGAAFFVGTFF